MMHFEVLDGDTVEGQRVWTELWLRWPKREIMAHVEYARLFARPGERTVCAVGSDAGGTVFLPLILRPIAAEQWARAGECRWDATNPYGYGGPFAWGPGPRDEAAFWRLHSEWCSKEKIVSTFLRLSLFPEQLACLPQDASCDRLNVVRKLAPGLDAIWKEYDRNVRNNVRCAERARVAMEVDRTGARLDAFLSVYGETMTRRDADPWYRFPPEFFTAIVERLRGHFAFFHALSGGEVVSSE
ncbi:MAG TPA: GNAT family N-acetyltransferase, partial [Anaeromyxobacteraceae bacterium]|nr:GNAT family N-acetyltransferase [Anaeromyxobacteraceae bacterium]